ncbi:MAG: aminopeptidase N [Myxococcota bacterium]|nr:aminopeptidase N [Myxococcota bacterium]
MSSEKPQVFFRGDYSLPDYWIDSVDLDFELGEAETLVRARLVIRRSETLSGDVPPLALVGEEIECLGVWLDGEALAESQYRANAEELVIDRPPARFELETLVRIKPQENTALSGLYRSSGIFCTQCEAMGFRRITYFLDRPDVMARYTTTITAEKTEYPVMLSNGNRVLEEDLADGRHRVRWEDPFPKPSYLFALVAGKLLAHRGAFTTRSGREVALEIWVEPQNVESCDHALKSLQRAMTWDEEIYGLEYDLDIYMIVAVNDFNMGAMENKGLNVFNSKCVLARPDTATDEDYEVIERVIGHEYFHNWTGNRVTCRDWFQLTLKEGLTVFRDQQFGGDMSSQEVTRIDDVKILRSAQFAEDAGPMSHPIRPDSYISMDNFYTSTVYNKGAEVIRMFHTLLGADGFRRGMDLYFERHDGQAVTCDDFRDAMATAGGRDLDRFGRWYSQAGTPLVEADSAFDAETGRYSLTLRQSYPESGAPAPDAREPLPIPIAVGLLGAEGEALPLRLEGDSQASTGETRVLELTDAEQTFAFEGLSQRPIPSLLRGFSAPVRLRMKRSREELAFLMGRDSDAFSRWDAGEQLATELLLDLAEASARGEELQLDPLYSDAFGRVLGDPTLDGSLKALALTLPSERILGQAMEVIDPDALFAAREFMRRALAEAHAESLEAVYAKGSEAGLYSRDKEAIDQRRLKNCALLYWMTLGGEDSLAAASHQFEGSDNMTDAEAALQALVDTRSTARDRALEAFYDRWQHDPLVIDKWFSIQATARRTDTYERVVELSAHPAFSLKNPNRLRSLVGVFCSANPVHFNRSDGAGYRFLAQKVMDLDPINPQVAARMVSIFNPWRRFDTARQGLMKKELETIGAQSALSKDVFEIVNRALAD